MPAGRNGDNLDQDEITNRTDAPEAPSHHRQRPLIALFDPRSSPVRSWIPLARHAAAGGGALDVGVGPGFGGLTERPIASQSQAWKVFIRPIPFVAMPFTRQMDDVYYFGIEVSVHNAGLLRSRIETASVVIADLTGANPNVYLEVGYAWGKGRPTILLVVDVGDLRFDVKSQRCLV